MSVKNNQSQTKKLLKLKRLKLNQIRLQKNSKNNMKKDINYLFNGKKLLK